jgi:hypothetical protein
MRTPHLTPATGIGAHKSIAKMWDRSLDRPKHWKLVLPPVGYSPDFLPVKVRHRGVADSICFSLP